MRRRSSGTRAHGASKWRAAICLTLCWANRSGGMAQGILGSWLLTGDADDAPIPGGGVVLDEQGCVLDVGPEAALRDRHASVKFDKQAAVLTPGLINAHTHLELSALRG